MEPESLKSVNSAKSLQSVQSFNSKPSVGSLNSLKTAKSNPTSEENRPQKKLKLASAHSQGVPSLNTAAKLSTITKRKRETEMRLQTERKKVSSLDMAFQKLQQKYEIHLKE